MKPFRWLLLPAVTLAVCAASSVGLAYASSQAAPKRLPVNGPLFFRADIWYSKFDPNEAVFTIAPSGRNLRRVIRWDDFRELADVSSDGRLIAWVQAGLVVTDRNLQRPRRVTPQGLFVGAPSWSPAGDALAMIVEDERAISIIGLDRRLRRKISIGVRATSVLWSPRRLEFAVKVSDRWFLANSRGRLTPITRESERAACGAWSPDGNSFVFSTWGDTPADLGSTYFVVRPDGTRRRRLAHHPSSIDASCAWSPDGRFIAYSPAGPVGANASHDPTIKRTIQIVTTSGRPVRRIRINQAFRVPDHAPPPKQIEYLKIEDWAATPPP